jgi:hypothetical protein
LGGEQAFSAGPYPNYDTGEINLTANGKSGACDSDAKSKQKGKLKATSREIEFSSEYSGDATSSSTCYPSRVQLRIPKEDNTSYGTVQFTAASLELTTMTGTITWSAPDPVPCLLYCVGNASAAWVLQNNGVTVFSGSGRSGSFTIPSTRVGVRDHWTLSFITSTLGLADTNSAREPRSIRLEAKVQGQLKFEQPLK